MQQGFPTDWGPRISAALVATHVAMLGLAVAAIAGLFLTTRRKVRRSDLFLWAIAIGLAPAIVIHLVNDDQVIRDAVAPFVFGYIAFNWLVAGTGFVQTVVRLKKGGDSVPLGWVIAALVALGILMTVMTPAVPRAREAARRTQCKSNLKQIGVALHNYKDDHGRFPPPDSGEPLVSWRVQLLPYLDAKQTYDRYDQTRNWNVAPNEAISKRDFHPYECPSNPHRKDVSDRFFTNYVMLTGTGTFGGNPAGVIPTAITDGMSNTIAVVEATGQEIVWTEPRDFDVTTQMIGINLKGIGKTDSPGMLSSYHPMKAHVLMADGSVRLISQLLDPAVLKKLMTIAGGERVNDGDY